MMVVGKSLLYLHKQEMAMEEKILSTKIRVYSYNELTDTRKKLVELAREATRRAYAPFS